MLELLKSIKRFSIATMILATIVGLLFIIFPSQCIKYTALVVGISMILAGVISIINYVVERDSMLPLIMGVIVVVCGIIVCVKYQALISIVVVLLGIFILAAGVGNLATGIKVLTVKKSSGWITLLLSIVTIVFGIIAITKSKELTETIVQFMGAALIVYAVLALVSFIQIMNIKNKVKKEINKQSDIEVEATEISSEDEKVDDFKAFFENSKSDDIEI